MLHSMNTEEIPTQQANFQFGRARSLEAFPPHVTDQGAHITPHRHPNKRHRTPLPQHPFPMKQETPFQSHAPSQQWDPSQQPVSQSPMTSPPFPQQPFAFNAPGLSYPPSMSHGHQPVPPTLPLPQEMITQLMQHPNIHPAFTQQLHQVPHQTPPNTIPAPAQQQSRQALLEQLKQKELEQQQQLLQVTNGHTSTHTSSATSPHSLSAKPTPPQTEERRLSHHDLIRQHNEEYRMKQAKKSAVQMANSRYGCYSGQDSNNFNFVVPVLPIHLIDENNLPPDLLKQQRALKQENLDMDDS